MKNVLHSIVMEMEENKLGKSIQNTQIDMALETICKCNQACSEKSSGPREHT
jgi:hypothetical protein